MIDSLHTAGAKAQKKLVEQRMRMPLMQMASSTVYNGERQLAQATGSPLVSNIPLVAAVPLAQPVCAGWQQPHVLARVPVLAQPLHAS